MPDEVTLEQVITELRDLRQTTLRALADTTRSVETSFRLFSGEIRLHVRELDSRLTQSDIKVDLSLAQLRHELHEIREVSQELLTIAHRHPEGAL